MTSKPIFSSIKVESPATLPQLSVEMVEMVPSPLLHPSLSQNAAKVADEIDDAASTSHLVPFPAEEANGSTADASEVPSTLAGSKHGKNRSRRLQRAIDKDNETIMSSLRLMKVFSVVMCLLLLAATLTLHLVREDYLNHSLVL